MRTLYVAFVVYHALNNLAWVRELAARVFEQQTPLEANELERLDTMIREQVRQAFSNAELEKAAKRKKNTRQNPRFRQPPRGLPLAPSGATPPPAASAAPTPAPRRRRADPHTLAQALEASGYEPQPLTPGPGDAV